MTGLALDLSWQSQRDCVFQPKVARNELPWVTVCKWIQPQRGCGCSRCPEHEPAFARMRCLVVVSPFNLRFHWDFQMNCQPEGILPSVTSIHTLNRNTNFRNKAIAFFRVC